MENYCFELKLLKYKANIIKPGIKIVLKLIEQCYLVQTRSAFCIVFPQTSHSYHYVQEI